MRIEAADLSDKDQVKIETNLHIRVTASKPYFFDVAHGRWCGRGVERGIVRMFWPEFNTSFIERQRLAEVAHMRHSINRLWEASPSSNPNGRYRVPKRTQLMCVY